jgi:seryl-tRNA synthetase
VGQYFAAVPLALVEPKEVNAMADEEKGTPELDGLKKEIEALRNKNRELLDEKKATKTGAERMLADAQDKIEELTLALDTSKREADKTIKALTKERDEVAQKVAESTKQARDFERSVILREALAKHGIGRRAAEDVGDAIAHIERMVQYGEDGQAFVKGEDGKNIPLAEYAEKVYPSTPHAKRFIPDGNSGAGASGNRGNVTTGQKIVSKADYDNLSRGDQQSMSLQIASGAVQIVD